MKLSMLVLLLAFNIWSISNAIGQGEYHVPKFQFMAYDVVPAWKAIIADWDEPNASVHLFDVKKYKGHGNYVCYGMKTGLRFSQFKELVRDPKKREYLPIFIYDLRKTPLMIDGKNYTWAVRLEHYNYIDDRASMEQTMIRLMQTVERYLKKQHPQCGKGIVILASKTAALPNMTVERGLKKVGYPASSMQAVISYMEKNSSQVESPSLKTKVKILNEGKAIGYLTFVKRGTEGQVNSDFKKILVYEELPYRVPIANGIITLQPQTPLSHINLLAKNRGTINAYCTDEKTIESWKKLYNGKLVEISCSNNNGQPNFEIKPISSTVATNYWKQQQRLKVTIPTADLSVSSFAHFSTGSSSVQVVNCIGAKAANYAKLEHLIPQYVKKGFAIPFYWYFKTMKDHKIDRLIDQLIKEKAVLSQEQLYERLETIRAKIMAASLDEQIFRELEVITTKYYKGKKVRLRSSTNCEDLPQFNGAGLYESKGFWEGSDRAVIQKKLLKVYASLWLPRAFDERDFFGIDHKKAGMAILINGAFPDEYANGVALTIPNSDGTTTISINTQYGELSVTNPEGGEEPEVIFFRNFDSKWYVIEQKSSVHNIFVENSKLTPSVKTLKSVMQQIEKMLKIDLSKSSDYGVDVEFKIMQEEGVFKLYVKQARLLNMVLPE